MIKVTKKKYISLLLTIAAVVIFTLPFWLPEKEIFIYSAKPLTSEEQGYVAKLQKIGYKAKHVALNGEQKSDIAIWFGSADFVKHIETSKAKYNFLYIEEYYPVNFDSLQEYPIILTPHKALYEHYVRSNIKTALLDIKNPTAAKQLKNIIEWLENN